MSPSALDPSIVRLIEDLWSENRIKVWSMVITIFGDCIVPRGGRVTLSSIQLITDKLGIEANALRTALSRLNRDGWLDRQRHGRQTSYALAGEGKVQFSLATKRIYAVGPLDWNGEFQIIIDRSENAQARKKARQNLLNDGFGSLAHGVFIRPYHSVESQGSFASFPGFTGQLMSHVNAREVTALAWPTLELQKSYEQLIRRFEPFLTKSATEPFGPLNAIVLRVLLIHEWRKIILKDVDLPAEFRPENWNGEVARKMTSVLYLDLIPESETFLDALEARPEVGLTAPVAEFAQRFT